MQTKQNEENNIYMNVVLADAFKAVYKQLDPAKKGYIKLKDLVWLILLNYIESNSATHWRGSKEECVD